MTPREIRMIYYVISRPRAKTSGPLFLPPRPCVPRAILLRCVFARVSACVHVCVCLPSPCVLSFLFLSYRSAHVAHETSIESVTLKNPLTRLRDRPYNSVTFIFRGHGSIQMFDVERLRTIFCFLCISIVIARTLLSVRFLKYISSSILLSKTYRV